MAFQQQPVEEIKRVRLPQKREVLGVVEQRLGGSRMYVKCLDNRIRISRIPGRLKRRLWVREGDIVIIEPWELGGDDKGDIVYKYRPIQVDFLKKKGHLKVFEDTEEF